MAKQMNDTELSVFFREMALFLRAGIGPYEGIEEILSDRPGDELLTALKEGLKDGVPFHDALQKTGLFPPYVTGMVRIGEEAGALDEVLSSLAGHYEREAHIRENIRGAILYPCLMIGMMLLIVFILLTRVLPVFAMVFSELGSDMGGVSAALLRFGEALNRASFLILIIFALLVLAFLWFYLTARGRQTAASFLQHFAPTRTISRHIALGRFADAFSLIFRSGIPLNEETIGMIRNLVGNEKLSEDIDTFRHRMEDDAMSIPDALKSAGLFSGLYSSLLNAGFKSGNQDKVLEHIARRYEHDTMRQIDSLVGVIEPTLVILLSIIVGIILLSVILPLLALMSHIG